MVMRFTGALMYLTALSAIGQDSTYEGVPVAEPLLVRGSVAISPGFMLQHPVTNIYVVGKLEVFTDKRISLRGEGLWYIDSQQRTPVLQQNSQLAFGPFYHFTSKRLDLCIGFEPGVAFSRPVQDTTFLEPAPLRAIPNMALCAGLTYSIWDYFQFFVDARYVHARYTGPYSNGLPLDEVLLGAGLGWQVPVKRLIKK